MTERNTRQKNAGVTLSAQQRAALNESRARTVSLMLASAHARVAGPDSLPPSGSGGSTAAREADR